MALINQNSLIGITSITSPSASNVLTVHTNDTTERLRVTTSGLSFSGTNASLDTSGNLTVGGNVSVGGTLTYEDVTNIDSVGVITSRDTIFSGSTGTAGQFVIRRDSDGANIGQFRSDAGTNDISIGNGGSGSLILKTGANTERLRITSGGLVGINTNDPQKTLHVNSTSANSFGIVRISGQNRGGQLEFCTDTTKTAGIYSPTSSNELVFFTSSSETERFRIDSDGRILQGTNSYKSNLNSSADTSGQLFQFVGKADNTNHCISVFAYSGTSNSARGAKLQLHRARSTDGTTNTAVAENDLIGTVEFKGNDATSFTAAAKIDCFVDGTPGTDDMPGRLVFSTSSDGSAVPTERLRIDSKGRLLVSVGTITAGTVQPGTVWSKGTDNLMISEGTGSGYTEGAFKSVSPSNYRGGGIFMYNANSGGTSNQWFAGRPYASSDQYIIARSTGVIVSDQSTAQTTHQLFTVYSSGNATLQGTLNQSGSDDKLKKNRTPLSSALDKVKTLEGFTYNWNDDAINNYGFRSDEGLLVGMSAQELQVVLPEAVKTVTKNKEVSDPTSGEAGEKMEYLTIQYDRVVPLLVEAIKELSSENTSLAARISALEGS